MNPIVNFTNQQSLLALEKTIANPQEIGPALIPPAINFLHIHNYENMRVTQTMIKALLVVATICTTSMAAVAADEKTNPDNTAINKRDRSGETNTSGDQSNSSADLKTTQAVRQALMKDNELSMTAKNIKVITANGQVTLRGPVKSAQEKAKIDQVAKSAAGGAQIVNQLDVKGTK